MPFQGLIRASLVSPWRAVSRAAFGSSLLVLAAAQSAAQDRPAAPMAGSAPATVQTGTGTATDTPATSDADTAVPADGQAEAPADAPADKAQEKPVYGPVIVRANSVTPHFHWTDPPPNVPPALADAIEIATKSDPSVLAAWSAARAALQDVKGAQWLRFPSLQVDFNAYNRATLGSRQFAPSLLVEVPIWTAGRISSNIDRAKALEQASVAQWRETVLDIANQVSDAYYNAALYTRLKSIYEDSLQRHKDLLETMRRRVTQEINPQADFELVRSRTAQIEQELASIDAQRLASLRTLAELVRDPRYRIGPVPKFDPNLFTENWDNVVAEAVAFSPTRERLQYQADAAHDEVKIARGAIFPQLNAQYSYSDFIGSRVGLGIRLQTSNGLSQFSAVSAAASRYEQASQQIGLAIRQLKQNVQVQVVAQQAAVERSKSSGVASETATRVSESYVRQFIAGRRSWLDLLNSIREDLANQVSLAQAEVTAMSTATRLNLSSGRWRLVHEDSSK